MTAPLEGLPRRWKRLAVVATLAVLCMVALATHGGRIRNYRVSELIWNGSSDPENDLGNDLEKGDPEGYPDDLTAEMLAIVEEQKEFLRKEIGDYRFNSSLDRPLRSVVLTTWRSGSTFLGEVLNSVPATWYHYEPLLDLGILQVREPPLSDLAISQVKQLMTCNYTGLEHHLAHDRAMAQHEQFLHNTRLWRHFKRHPDVSWSPAYLAAMCRLSPVQSVKIVRLRLRLAEQLIADPELNARLVLLVRDPRGTLESRTHREWCLGVPDCSDPAVLCADLEDDHRAALHLAARFPDSFRVVRYEDLCSHPYEGVAALMSFFGLAPHPAVQTYLDTHTRLKRGGVSSTFRNSRVAPFLWRTKWSHEQVLRVQGKCARAMRLWGYLPALNHSHQQKFNPVEEQFRLRAEEGEK